MQKSKRKQALTAEQELSAELSEQLIRKIVVVKGRLCLRGQESNPIAMLATGPEGPRGRDGRTPVKGVDYHDGKDGAAGSRGLRGQRGEAGAVGATGSCGCCGRDGKDAELLDAKWEGTSLSVKTRKGWTPYVDLKGATGLKGDSVEGPRGRDAQPAKAIKGDPGIMPGEVLTILSDLEDVKKRLAKLEKRK